MSRSRYLCLGLAIVVLWSIYALHGSQSQSGPLAGQVPLGSTTSPRGGASVKDGNKKTSIAIITMTTEQSSYQHLSLKNKWKYSKVHGYDLIVDFEYIGKSAVWHKLNMMEAAINKNKYDWIWWIDFDTIITNMNLKLESIISESLRNHTSPEKVDWLLTADCFPLNAGSMLLRSGSRTMKMITAIRDYGKENPKLSEQDCLRDIIEKDLNHAKEQVVMIPQWKINSFPAENECYDVGGRGWKEGDLVVHLAGAWAYLQNHTDPYGEMMRRYEKHIIWPEEKKS